MIPRRALASATVLLALAAAACADAPPVSESSVAPPVRTEIAHAGPHTAQITILGVVRPAETVAIAAADGGIVAYPPRFAAGLRTGAEVKAGETLASFDNEAVRLELAEARLAAEGASAELERKTSSYEAGIISQAEFSEAEIKSRLSRERLTSAERKTASLVVTSPRSGRLVVARGYPPGVQVSAGTVLAELAADGAPRVEGWAAGSDLEALRPGLPVTFLSARGKAAGRGEIREVASVLDEAGTARVVAGVADSKGLPPPGEGVEMLVDLERGEEVITVPEEAILMDSGGSVIYVAESAGQFMTAKRVPITLGRRGGGRVEVRAGLADGARVIVSGASILGDGMRVREVPQESKAGDPGRSGGEPAAR